MFKDCSNLEEIPKNITDWDVKNVRSMKDIWLRNAWNYKFT